MRNRNVKDSNEMEEDVYQDLSFLASGISGLTNTELLLMDERATPADN